MADILYLSLPLDFFGPPLLGRAAFQQKIIHKDPFVVNDDVVSSVKRIILPYLYSLFLQISFNTQGSSQWDSLRHFAYQKEKKFYNGYYLYG